MTDDQDLVRKLRNGDQTALRSIYERYKNDLVTVAGCLLTDGATAEDVLHDVFVAFVAQVVQLRLRGSLRGYLVACVANRARDELRRRSCRPASLEEIDKFVGALEGPAEAAIDCEEAGRLHAALAELPYEQREVIVLHLQGDLTFREVARQQGVSPNTVQSRYRYGLDKLRSVLNAGART
ncbi:MAG: sigma-70 family RNA polymerase sigma factor [Planctomycetota bacterium]